MVYSPSDFKGFNQIEYNKVNRGQNLVAVLMAGVQVICVVCFALYEDNTDMSWVCILLQCENEDLFTICAHA